MHIPQTGAFSFLSYFSMCFSHSSKSTILRLDIDGSQKAPFNAFAGQESMQTEQSPHMLREIGLAVLSCAFVRTEIRRTRGPN